MLYELLTGAPPFTGRSPEELIGKVLGEAVPPIRERCPDVPAELASIVEKALHREPEGRYRNAGELALELESYHDGRRVRAHEYSRTELLGRFAARYRLPLSATGAALVALVVTGALAYQR